MARINLLPWRIERRRQREREFYMQLGLAAIAGVLAVLLLAFWMGMRMDNQEARNGYLQTQIKQLDVRIKEIKDLERVQSQLLARKKIIEQLQSNRSQMVHLFDALVKSIPDSTRLTKMTQRGARMMLNGVAQSNASVADYMRSIAKSPWLGSVDLRKTQNHHGSGRMPYSFDLDVHLNTPADAAEMAEANDALMDEPASSTSAGAPSSAASVAAPADAPVDKGGAKP